MQRYYREAIRAVNRFGSEAQARAARCRRKTASRLPLGGRIATLCVCTNSAADVCAAVPNRGKSRGQWRGLPNATYELAAKTSRVTAAAARRRRHRAARRELRGRLVRTHSNTGGVHGKRPPVLRPGTPFRCWYECRNLANGVREARIVLTRRRAQDVPNLAVSVLRSGARAPSHGFSVPSRSC